MVGLFVLTPWPISRSRFFLLLLVGAFFRRGGAERFHGRAEDGPNGLPGQCGGRGGNGRGRGRRQALPKRGRRALFRGNVSIIVNQNQTRHVHVEGGYMGFWVQSGF